MKSMTHLGHCCELCPLFTSRHKIRTCNACASIASLLFPGVEEEESRPVGPRPDLMQGSALQGDLEGRAVKGPYPEGAQRYPNPDGVSQDREAVTATAAWVAMETAEPLHQDPGDEAVLLQPEIFCSGLSYSGVTEDIKTMCWFTQRAIDNVYTSLKCSIFLL